MDFLDDAAMWAATRGVGAAANVYGHGRAAYDDARQVVNPIISTADSAVNIGLDMATNTAQQGFDSVERGIAGAVPGVIDTGVSVINGARETVERPIDWATQRAVGATQRVAGAAADAWSWMTD